MTNIKRVIEIHQVIKDNLPSTYPTAQLAFYETEEQLLKHAEEITKEDDENVYAVVDPDTLTINIPLTMELKYEDKSGEIYTKTHSINKMSDDEVALTLLHEIGHLFHGKKYGWKSKEYSDEPLQDRFASRWLKRLKKKKLI